MVRRAIAAEQPRLLIHVGGMPPPIRDIQETVHPIGWRGDRHRHAFWQLVLNRSGTAIVRRGRDVRVVPGQMVVIPPGLSHAWRNAGDVPLDLLNIHLFPRPSGSESLPGYLRSVTSDATRLCLCPVHPRTESLSARAVAEMSAGARGYKWQAASALTDIVMTALRGIWHREGRRGSEAGAAGRVEEILRHIEVHYDQPLTLADVGRMLHVTPKHACEIFTRETGTSPMRRLREVRVEKAQVFLEDTTLPVKQVAFAVGYRDEHYFSRAFHKVTGISPLAWRRQGRG